MTAVHLASRPVAAVLFDLDGTLIDSAPDLGAAADRMRTDRGLPSLPAERYRPVAGAGARGLLGVAFGVTPEHPSFPELREEFFCNYEQAMTVNTQVFDGVAELVAGLQRAGLTWGVVTNKAARFTLPLTAALPLFRGAQVVISGDTTAHAKPHPAPLLEAARRMGVAAPRCVYVGDDERDVQAGLKAGMVTVAAAYGYLGAGHAPQAWGAHHCVAAPGDLLRLLSV